VKLALGERLASAVTSSYTACSMHQSDQDRAFVRRVISASVHLAILTAWVTLCGRFVLPFFFPVLWGAIIATAVWPLFTIGFRGRPKLGAAVFLLLALALLLVPAWLAIESIANQTIEFGRRLAHGDLALPPPNPRVAEWPVVGERVFNAWQRAFETPSALVERLLPQVRPAGQWLMQSMGHLLGALVQSLFAVILAAVFLANADACKRGVTRVVEKLLPERGEHFTNLAGATVRSVAQGVIGIAIVQSLAAGLGLVLAGVPGAGVWSALVLALAVMQLPPLLVLGPAAIYVFNNQSTVVSIIFLLWSLLVSASDGLLKPFVLGRGVGVPTLVILMGAIGGMISDGIIGLFVGSVVLAVGYQIAAAWTRNGDPVEPVAS
jgi:predicted PurR-regulated permease PerM